MASIGAAGFWTAAVVDQNRDRAEPVVGLDGRRRPGVFVDDVQADEQDPIAEFGGEFQKRAATIEAATRLFLDAGYAGTPMAEVAGEARYGVASNTD